MPETIHGKRGHLSVGWIPRLHAPISSGTLAGKVRGGAGDRRPRHYAAAGRQDIATHAIARPVAAGFAAVVRVRKAATLRSAAHDEVILLPKRPPMLLVDRRCWLRSAATDKPDSLGDAEGRAGRGRTRARLRQRLAFGGAQRMRAVETQARSRLRFYTTKRPPVRLKAALAAAAVLLRDVGGMEHERSIQRPQRQAAGESRP
jgi:hypothetical protein